MGVPPDVMAALQDTGGPPGPDGLVGGPPGSPLEHTGGPPGPDALVGGPGAGPPPGGPPETATGGQGQPGVAENPDFTRLIKMAIDALKQSQDTDEDDVDKHLAAQCLEKLQGLLGSHQKQRDSALGMTDVHRGVRRAIRSGGGGAG